MQEYQVRVYPSGHMEWRQNGQRHRLNGPAIEYANGAKSWYQNDKLHRTDGPACEYADGTKYWYIEGMNYTEREFKKKTEEMNAPTCSGKTVTIDGIEYQLIKK